MDRRRIEVTHDALAKALTIWLGLAPMWTWREMEKQSRENPSEDPRNDFSARKAMAKHLADKFRVSGWKVNHPEPTLPTSSLPESRD
jgi:hypothetical protein